jgi:hypothetical protein
MKNAAISLPVPTADSAEAMATLGNLRQALKDCLHLVEAGTHPDLLGELPQFARTLVEALEAAAASHPDLLAQVARFEVTWPVLAARHHPQGQDFAALADRIQLGADVVVSVLPRATCRLDSPLNRFLLQVLVQGCLAPPRDFYFLGEPEHPPKLTRQSLPWYLDEYLLPLLDDLRQREGSWNGVPAVADLVAGMADAEEQRRVAREQIRLALLDLAGPEGAASLPGPEKEAV